MECAVESRRREWIGGTLASVGLSRGTDEVAGVGSLERAVEDRRHTCERRLVKGDRRGHGRRLVGMCRGIKAMRIDRRHTCERRLVKGTDEVTGVGSLERAVESRR